VPHSKTTESVDSPYKVQVLDRALALLDTLSKQAPDASLGDLRFALKLHKSTVHRLLMVLERHRLVEKNAQSGRYRLGLKLFELGSKAIGVRDLRELARPYLQRLQQDTQETVNLAILDHQEVLYIEKVEPQQTLRMTAAVGHRYPLHCTALGKAILGAMPEAEAIAILRQTGLKPRTRNSITSAAAMREELRATRARGCAIDDQENEEGARCVGAAVRDHLGNVVGAISVSGPAMRVGKNKIPGLARLVMDAASWVSVELGFRERDLKNAAAAGD
jgi:DNA-binding IclR family transcriptional regulator